jgi:hypothetical protein
MSLNQHATNGLLTESLSGQIRGGLNGTGVVARMPRSETQSG